MSDSARDDASDFEAAWKRLSRDVLTIAEVCHKNARTCQDNGRHTAAQAYQHAAKMARKAHAGEEPNALEDALQSSVYILGGHWR